MLQSRFRRICVLLVFLALTIGWPLNGMQGLVMMPQSAVAATADAISCLECECCEDKGTTDASTCAMTCAGMVASLPGDEVADVTAPTVLIAEAVHSHAGFSIAPDPSPPRPPS